MFALWTSVRRALPLAHRADSLSDVPQVVPPLDGMNPTPAGAVQTARERHEIIAHLMMAAFFIGLVVFAMILIDLGSTSPQRVVPSSPTAPRYNRSS